MFVLVLRPDGAVGSLLARRAISLVRYIYDAVFLSIQDSGSRTPPEIVYGTRYLRIQDTYGINSQPLFQNAATPEFGKGGESNR